MKKISVSRILEYNELTQIEMLTENQASIVDAVRMLAKKVEALGAAMTTGPSVGPEKERKAPKAPDFRRIEIMARWPSFTEKSKIKTFDEHVATLGSEPSKSRLSHWFVKGEPWPKSSDKFIEKTKLEPAQARAYLYFMRMLGWVRYCENTKTYEEIPINRPGPVVNGD